MPEWMKAGNTAVITGGASGIGLEAARRYAAAGMNLVIADRNEDALKIAADELAEISGGSDKILGQSCDVSDRVEVEALRDAAFDRFDMVHCLMNNAGMGKPVGAPWEDADALKEIMSVNLGGIINGCHAFIPKMLESGAIGAVINTGSKQGITRPPGNYAYNLSKAGVLAYSESVAHAFAVTDGCKLTAHLLVPGFVYTPMISRFIPEKPPGAWTAEQTLDFALERLDEGDFYVICPDNEATREIDEKRIRWNAEDIIKNRPASSRWHPDYEGEFAEYMKD